MTVRVSFFLLTVQRFLNSLSASGKICFYLFLDLISDLILDVFDLQSGRELGCIYSELQSGSIWRQALPSGG